MEGASTVHTVDCTPYHQRHHNLGTVVQHYRQRPQRHRLAITLQIRHQRLQSLQHYLLHSSRIAGKQKTVYRMGKKITAAVTYIGCSDHPTGSTTVVLPLVRPYPAWLEVVLRVLAAAGAYPKYPIIQRQRSTST